MKIKALIVDDEIHSRNTLRNYIEKYTEGITVVAEAQNIKEAEALIQKHQPDLCFLDVEMPFGRECKLNSVWV